MHLINIISSLLFTSTVVLSKPSSICPILGRQFPPPPPSSLTTAPVLINATSSLEKSINEKLKTGPYNATSFSIGMFSSREDGLIYEFHHTDETARNSSIGTQHVDKHTVYRLGSISKLLTVYIFLIREGGKRLYDPITDFLPELAKMNMTSADVDAVVPQWEEITIGELASHLGGLMRDYGQAVDLASLLPGAFPALPASDKTICNIIQSGGSVVPCTENEYLGAIANQQPVFLPSTTPIYSNNGFGLLGLAIAASSNNNNNNKTFDQIFDEELVTPLHLHSTSSIVPASDTHGIIPGGRTSSGWSNDLGPAGPAGGHFSSTADLANIGKSILSSSLISRAETRRWLKPVSFLEDVTQGVGMPWEIFRVEVSGQTVELYTKSGNWGAYNNVIVLVPIFDFGFTILTASTSSSNVWEDLTNMIVAEILPALERVVREQAEKSFAGTYRSSTLNSSITLAVDAQPGVKVTQWTSNGTDLKSVLFDSALGSDFRLVPNELYGEDSGKVGFTGIYHNPAAGTSDNSTEFYWHCPSWTGVSALTYGNIGLEQFVFSVDGESGEAKTVVSKALRIEMEREV